MNYTLIKFCQVIVARAGMFSVRGQDVQFANRNVANK